MVSLVPISSYNAKMTSKLFAELCMFKNVANSLVMAAGEAATATLHLVKKEYNQGLLCLREHQGLLSHGRGSFAF